MQVVELKPATAVYHGNVPTYFPDFPLTSPHVVGAGLQWSDDRDDTYAELGGNGGTEPAYTPAGADFAPLSSAVPDFYWWHFAVRAQSFPVSGSHVPFTALGFGESPMVFNWPDELIANTAPGPTWLHWLNGPVMPGEPSYANGWWSSNDIHADLRTMPFTFAMVDSGFSGDAYQVAAHVFEARFVVAYEDGGRLPPLRQVQRGDGLGSSVPRAVQNQSRQASLRAGRAFI